MNNIDKNPSVSLASTVTNALQGDKQIITLGTTKVYIGNDQYIDRPAWAPANYPDSVSLTALGNIDSDVIRGVNGLPCYEYLIVKYRDFNNRSGIFVLFFHKGNGQFGGCKVHGGGSAINSFLYNFRPLILVYKNNVHRNKVK